MLAAEPTLRRARRASVLGALCWIAQAACVGMAIEFLLPTDERSTAKLDPAWAALGFLAFGLIRAAAQHRASSLARSGADEVIGVARRRILEQQLQRSPLDPAAPASADLASLLNEKLALLAPYVQRYSLAAARVRSAPLLILVLTALLYWPAALAMLVATPLIPLFMALVGYAAREASARQLVELGTLNGLLMERLTALQDIRLLGAENTALRQFAQTAEQLRRNTMRVLRIAFLSSTVLELFASLGIAMAAVLVGFRLLDLLEFGSWGRTLAVGEGVFILLLAPDYFQPMRDLAAAWHDRAAAQAVADEVQVLEQQEPLRLPQGESNLQHFDALGSEGLCVKFAGAYSIKLPDIHVKRGQLLAISGASGAGKSTLLSVLAGLRTADEGRVFIDSTELAPAQCGALQKQVAWVPQQPHFRDATLEDNLLFDAEIPAEQLQLALQQTAAHNIVARLPQGLQTPLGETGTGVSGGEARRLTLARAALHDRPILLADEPTADLDSTTAASIRRALRELAYSGRIVIVATHDAELMAAADRHVVLDDAPVVNDAVSTIETVQPVPTHTSDRLADEGKRDEHAIDALMDEVQRDHKAARRDTRWHPGALIGTLWQSERRYFIAAMLLSMSVLVAGGALLGVSGWFIVAAGAAGLAGLGTVFDIFSPGAAVRFLALARTASRYGERVLSHELTLRALLSLRLKVLAHTLRQPLDALRRWRAPSLLNRLIGDVDALDGLVLRVFLPFIAAAVALLLAFIVLWAMNGLTVAVVVVLLPSTVVLSALLQASAATHQDAREQDRAQHRFREQLIDLLRSRVEWILYARQQDAAQKLMQTETTLRRSQAQLDQQEYAVMRLASAVLALAGAGAILIGTAAVAEGHSVALALMMPLMLTLAINEAFMPLGRGVLELGRIQAAGSRLARLLDLDSLQSPHSSGSASAGSAAGPHDDSAPLMQLHQLEICRPDSTQSLLAAPLSLALNPGQRIALAGPSGIGKSTLLQAMAGDDAVVLGGEILLSGVAIRQLEDHALFDSIAMLPQRSAVMAGSILDALRLADAALDETRAWAVLKAVGLDHTIRKRGGLALHLGEAGKGLSGGERRRLALARVLLRPGRLLLLDEPTEGLDRAMAETVLEGVAAFRPDALIVVAAHRQAELDWATARIDLHAATQP